MAQERVNGVVRVLGRLGRAWNAILLAFSVFMALFLLTLAFRQPGSLGAILFGVGVFAGVAILCYNDLKRSPKDA